MGILSGTRDVGSFRSHHSLADTRNLVVHALAGQLSVDEIVERTPGILDSIYFSRLSGETIALTAGNSTRERWSLVVDLAPGNDFVDGRVYFNRRQIDAYGGNASDATHSLARVLDMASVVRKSWKY